MIVGDKIEIHLSGPPSKLGTNHRRRGNWRDANDLTERCKKKYIKEIAASLKKQGITLEKGIPCFEYARVTFTLIAPNKKVVDPDNLAPMCKPALDCMTIQSDGIPLLWDDKGRYVEVLYQVRLGSDKKRKAWLKVIMEGLETPSIVTTSPSGIGKNMDW